MTIIKNPLTIVKQETQTVDNSVKSFEPNSSPVHSVLLPNGSWWRSGNSYSHGTLMSSATTALSFNPHNYSSYRFITKATIKAFTKETCWLWGANNGTYATIYPVFYIARASKVMCEYRENASEKFLTIDLTDKELETEKAYYCCTSWNAENGLLGMFIYDENGDLIGENSVEFDNSNSATCDFIIGGSPWQNAHLARDIYIDLTETVIEAGGTVLWGQHNDKTRYMGIITPEE